MMISINWGTIFSVISKTKNLPDIKEFLRKLRGKIRTYWGTKRKKTYTKNINYSQKSQCKP